MQKQQHNMTGVALKGLAMVALALAAWVMTGEQARAIAVPLDPTGFAPTDTLIDFSVLGANTPLTTQYQDDGVIFSGGFYGNTTYAYRFPNGNPACASNFNFGVASYNYLTIDFTSTVSRAGMDIFFNFYSHLYLRAYQQVDGQYVETGYLDLFNNTAPDGSFFTGLTDATGIDRLTLYMTSPYSVIMIDNLRFDMTSASSGDEGDPVVPEPATMALIGLGLAGVGLVRRRRA